MNDPLIGSHLSVFRVERLLGRGGMASVYVAWDTSQNRQVALKVLDERYREIPASVKRFIQEAQTVAAWDHPNIIRVLDAGEDQGVYFYAMEFIRGLDLAQLLRQYQEAGSLLPYDEVLRIGWAIGNALDFAHQRGIIHRDVKPSNILVSVDGRILLSDFGLVMDVSVGTMGETFGSPHYIAPEQARRSSNAVPQSDIYSLGVVLFEMLTGVVPFHDPSPAALALKHLAETPPLPRSINPRLSQGVEAVLLRALRKTPAERYATGREMMAALERSLSPDMAQTEAGQPLPALAETQIAWAGQRPPATAASAPPGNGGPVFRAGSAQAFPPRSIPSVPPPAAPAAARRGRSRGWGCLVLLLAVVALVSIAGVVMALNNPGWFNLAGLGGSPTTEPTQTLPPTLTITAQLTNTPAPTLTQTQQPTDTITPLPTDTPEPTEPPPTETPTPTITPLPPASLAIVHVEDAGMFLVNVGEVPLPLVPFEIWDNDPEIAGEEWEIELLQPEQCVTAWDENGSPRLPEDLECEIVGEQVTRRNRTRVWTRAMHIRYADEEITTCPPNNRVCEFEIDLNRP